MPAPVIQTIGEQNITIDTEYSLVVSITGSPAEAYVEGLQEGFVQDWDANAGTLTISGTATRLLADAVWTVYAKETAQSVAVTQDIEYNVVPDAPIIDEIGAVAVYQGVESNFFIQLDNKPVQHTVDGLLVGLKSDFEVQPTEDPDETPIEGIRVDGMFPAGNVISVTSRNFPVTAENEGGMDAYNLPVTVHSTAPPAMSALSKSVSGGVLTFSWTAVSGAISYAYRIGADGEWVDVGQVTTSPVTLPDGQSPPIYWRVNSPWIGEPVVTQTATVYIYSQHLRDVVMIGQDGSVVWTYAGIPMTEHVNFYHFFKDHASNPFVFFTQSRNIYKINSMDGTLLWQVTAASGSYGLPVVDSDDNIILFDNTNYRVRKVSGVDGAQLWSRQLAAPHYESGDQDGYYAPVLDGDDNIILFTGGQSRSNNIVKINGSDGTVAWSYRALPALSSGDQYRAVEIDNDGNIFTIRKSNRNIYKINGNNGSLAWSSSVLTQANGTTEGAEYIAIDDEGDVYVAYAGIVMVTSIRGQIYKIDGSDGTEVWHHENIGSGGFPYEKVLFGSGGDIYVVHRDVKAYKLNSAGTQVWEYTLFSGDYDVPPILDNNGSLIFYNDTNNRIYVVSAAGLLLWNASFPSSSNTNGRVILLSDQTVALWVETNKVLYKYSGTGTREWDYTSPDTSALHAVIAV